MLAAGMGKRLGRFTKNSTKCMVPVNGKTLIEYAIESLIQCGIKKFVMVVGYKSEVLINFIKEKFPEERLCGMEIEFIENPIYDKTNNIYSLYLAKNRLSEDDTLLLESDLIFKKEILSSLISSSDKNVAVVSKFEPWMDGTCTLLNCENQITQIVDKSAFKWNHTEDYYKTVNIYKFSKDFSKNYYIPFLEAYQKAFGENEYYEQVLKVISFLSSTAIKGMKVSGDDWYEIDDAADLAIAEDRFANNEEKIKRMQHRYGGYWRFPNMKDFCYLVNPYFPPQNMIDELSSNFKTLLTQYPSGAAQQSLLLGKIFNILPENIVAGNGAAELIASLGEKIQGTVAIPYPTFNEYPERFINAKTVPVPVDKEAFSYTAEDILKTVRTSGAKTVLLINPDNPSGNFLNKKDVLLLCSELKKLDAKLIFDESFIDFAQKDERYTLLDDKILMENPNLIVVKSISKSYGVPGLRLGLLASSDSSYVKQIQKKNAIWNINSFAEYYLQIYDKYKKLYAAACDKIAEERERFAFELAKIPDFYVFPSQANFLMCRLDGKFTASELTQILMQRYNLFIKDLTGKKCFENGKYIRLAVRDKNDNDALLCALKEILC